MIVQGILHLLTGFDHLAFMLVARQVTFSSEPTMSVFDRRLTLGDLGGARLGAHDAPMPTGDRP